MAKKQQGPVKSFPKIKPYHFGFMDTEDGHKIYFEECGNRNGFPVMFFHGGPGVGCTETDRRFFNPEKWRVILFDQRGSGRSRPIGSLKNNTTDHLVSDFKKITENLKIKKAVFFGGSWGSTLALVCAIRYPELVAGMVLRGIFLATRREIKEYSVGIAGNYFPEVRERFISHVPKKHLKDVVDYYHQKIICGNAKKRKTFAYEWGRYEDSMLGLKPKSDEDIDRELGGFPFENWVRVEIHYMKNKCFLEDGYILKNARRIPNIPIVIIQGRYDMVCLPINAYSLHSALRRSELRMVLSGHSAMDPEITKNLISETEAMYEKVR